MSTFDRNKLITQLDDIIYEAIDLGTEIGVQENENAFDDGHNQGYNDCERKGKKQTRKK